MFKKAKAGEKTKIFHQLFSDLNIISIISHSCANLAKKIILQLYFLLNLFSCVIVEYPSNHAEKYRSKRGPKCGLEIMIKNWLDTGKDNP